MTTMDSPERSANLRAKARTFSPGFCIRKMLAAITVFLRSKSIVSGEVYTFPAD
jgi:hypothetical protein